MRKRKDVSTLEMMQELDNVDLVPIHAEDHDGNELEHNMVGTGNLDTKTLLGVFGDDYRLVRHEQVVDKVSKHFGDNFRGNYFIGENCKNLAIYIYPEEMRQLVRHEKRDTEEWISFGLRVMNSYDGTSALKVSSIGFREVCSNGMWAETWADRSWQRHTGSVELSKLDRTITKIVNADFDDIIMTYKEASEEMVKSTPVLLREVWKDKHKKMQEVIIREVGSKASKWDIYNRATEYITHHGDGSSELAETTLERKHKDANKILEVNLDEINWSQDITLVGEE